MNYEQVLQALKDEKFVDIGGIWSFFGRSMTCPDGCCNDGQDTLEEAAEMVMILANKGGANITII
jgi:hypothetical protein